MCILLEYELIGGLKEKALTWLRDYCNEFESPLVCKACIQPCGRFPLSLQAITHTRRSGLMTGGIRADRSSVIERMTKWRSDGLFPWSFVYILINYTGLESPRWRCTP